MILLMLTDAKQFFKDLWDSIFKFWFTSESGDAPYIYNALAALIWLILGYFLIKLILAILRKAMKLGKKEKGVITVKSFVLDVLKVFLYLIDLVIILKILRIEMSGASTVFSSAIIAIGLSLQDLIGNFVSGLIILSGKYFAIGDYISVKDCAEGEVQTVRFIFTTLKTYTGQKVIISNSAIIKSVITNYSVNPYRLVRIDLTFSYLEKPDVIKKLLLNLAKKEKQVLKYPEPTVNITSLDKNGVIYSLVCTSGTNDYWGILYSLNERIVKELQNSKILVQPNKVELIGVEPVKKI